MQPTCSTATHTITAAALLIVLCTCMYNIIITADTCAALLYNNSTQSLKGFCEAETAELIALARVQ